MSSSHIRPGKPYIYTSPVPSILEDQHTGWLYRYYDATGDLLYIGSRYRATEAAIGGTITGRLEKRRNRRRLM